MMIEVEHVTRLFGPVIAVDDISFAIDKGQVVGFLGLNGAGKTTTMRILTTYLAATEGVVRVAGHDVLVESMDVRRNIGYLPDSVPLYPEMRVEEFLEYRARLKSVDRKQRPKRIEYCLERCRIHEVRRRLLGTLSRGYRQRVGLADALVHDPVVLILDEPTAGLDVAQQNETLSLIKELGADHTVLFSTHRMGEVEATCNQVIVIHQGRLRLQRNLKELARDAPLIAEIRGPKENVTEVLAHTDGVSRVTSRGGEDGVRVYKVYVTTGKDPREAVGKRLVEADFGVRSLSWQGLHDYFLEMIEDTQAPIVALS